MIGMKYCNGNRRNKENKEGIRSGVTYERAAK
jgi:hypothetical protein